MKVTLSLINHLRQWAKSYLKGVVVKDGNLTYSLHPDIQVQISCSCQEPLTPVLRDDDVYTFFCSKCEAPATLYQTTVSASANCKLELGDGTTSEKWGVSLPNANKRNIDD